MDHAGAVEGVEPLRQLPQRRAQPPLVEAAPWPRRGLIDRTLARDVVREHATAQGDVIAFTYGDEQISFAELSTGADRVANGLVALGSIADISLESSLSKINRYDRARFVTVTADLNGIALGDALAMALRVPATRIGAIVKGERSVTADTALRLARFFGTSAEFWINLQAMHDLTKARQESGSAIERDVSPRAA